MPQAVREVLKERTEKDMATQNSFGGQHCAMSEGIVSYTKTGYSSKPLPPLCMHCKKEKVSDTCTVCHTFHYCSQKCRDESWPGHREGMCSPQDALEKTKTISRLSYRSASGYPPSQEHRYGHRLALDISSSHIDQTEPSAEKSEDVWKNEILKGKVKPSHKEVNPRSSLALAISSSDKNITTRSSAQSPFRSIPSLALGSPGLAPSIDLSVDIQMALQALYRVSSTCRAMRSPQDAFVGYHAQVKFFVFPSVLLPSLHYPARYPIPP